MSLLLERKITLDPPARARFLDQLLLKFNAAATWEASRGIIKKDDGFSKLTSLELYNFGLQISNAETIWDIYRMLASNTFQGESWYDAIVGIQHKDSYKAIRKLLQRVLEPKIVPDGLDVGTGSGETAKVLATICNQVTATDVVPEMLSLAQRKIRARNIKFMCDDIMNTSFGEGSFDVILIQGIGGFIAPEEQPKLLDIFHYILKPGGKAYQFENLLHADKVYQQSPRAQLTGFIAAAINEFTFMHQVADMAMFNTETHGFTSGYYLIDGMPGAKIHRFDRI